MKKLGIICLMVFMAFMFSCDNGDDTKNDGLTVITLTPTSLIVEVNDSADIDYVTDPPDVRITWTSSNTAVAQVASGAVYGESVGTATITATAPDGGKATCEVTVIAATKNYWEVENETLVHYTPKLERGGGYGNGEKITPNADGSATFTGNEAANTWDGGGVNYAFPAPKTSETWAIADYDLVELHLKVTEGSVTTVAKRLNNAGQVNLYPYPTVTPLSNTVLFNKDTADGVVVFKTVIGEAAGGVGFQRNGGGPATISIEKAVFSKATMHTIKFEGGDYTNMPAIADIKIPDGRTVNFAASNYNLLAIEPERSGYTFTGWQVKSTNTAFVETTAITSDITLVAQWEEGEPEEPDMTLNLDVSTWGTLPNIVNDSWPTDYAIASYNNGKLTLEFSGATRQKGAIPLSPEQTSWLMRSDVTAITFRINGAAYKEDGVTRFNADAKVNATNFAQNKARFRVHLANPGGSGVSPGTANVADGQGDPQSIIIDNLVYSVGFADGAKDRSNLSYFVIQAMYDDGSGGAGGPPVSLNEKVKFIIESVVIDIGNTVDK